MMKISALVALLPFFAYAFSGSKATEAKLSFEHFVDVPEMLYNSGEAQEKVEEQITHMFGPMTFRPSNAKARGADRGDGTPVILSTEQITEKVGNEEREIIRIHYRYETIAVIGTGPQVNYLLALPRNPEEAYNKSGGETPKNLCTDDHYTSYGDFWYFWSPWRKGCGGKLLVSGVDYDLITARIQRLPNVTNSEVTSYPEYDRLAKNGKIRIFLLMGLDEPVGNHSPMKGKKDLNRDNFKKIREEILKIGTPTRGSKKQKEEASKDGTKTFQARKWTDEEIGNVIEERTTPFPYVESFTKQFPGNGRAQEVEVVMFLGKTGIDQGSKGFHWFLKYALSQGSIMIYDGHSGLGGHLDLRDIEKRRTDSMLEAGIDKEFRFYFPKERYQIYYFNSCSSYTYYNTMYFSRKKNGNIPGTKNLDVIGTGLETDFEGGVETNMELITTTHNYVAYGTVKSYRNLLSKIENDNLSGVNGDEDNPQTQEEAGDGR